MPSLKIRKSRQFFGTGIQFKSRYPENSVGKDPDDFCPDPDTNFQSI
jgi:hypothetical protein